MYFLVPLTLSLSTFNSETDNRKCEIALGGWHWSEILYTGTPASHGLEPSSLQRDLHAPSIGPERYLLHHRGMCMCMYSLSVDDKHQSVEFKIQLKVYFPKIKCYHARSKYYRITPNFIRRLVDIKLDFAQFKVNLYFINYFSSVRHSREFPFITLFFQLRQFVQFHFLISGSNPTPWI